MLQCTIKTVFLGGTESLSKEESKQGDPVSMAICGIGVTPLINMLIDIFIDENRVQVKVSAYTDINSAISELRDLKIWWNALKEIGPKFEYYPEHKKTWLVVKPYETKYMSTVFSFKPKASNQYKVTDT